MAREKMERTTPLDSEALIMLKFKFDGGMWAHSQEERFAIKLTPTCFYVSFHGYQAKFLFNLTVGELEKQFYKRTGRLLF